MANIRIAASTGKIDKRCLNGNNNTRRGPDRKPRKQRDIVTLRPEVKGGLRARLDMLVDFYGTKAEMARRLDVPYSTVMRWFARGRISAEGARRVHRDYKRNGYVGYRASFCRPDLKFDDNGRAVGKREIKRMYHTIKSTNCKKDNA